MKRILIYILLLANLCTGIAFAWDTHPEAMVGHAAAIDLVAGQNHDHPDGDLHHSDHCCHGAAHLVGIVFCPITVFVANSHDQFFALSQTPHLLYITPLLRPPIV